MTGYGKLPKSVHHQTDRDKWREAHLNTQTDGHLHKMGRQVVTEADKN